MTYGLSTRAFIEDGPVEQVARLESTPHHRALLAVLNEACRLAVIERALGPANDRIDGYPIAL